MEREYYELIFKLRNHPDVVAVKVWSRDDIAAELETYAYQVTDENVDAVLSFLDTSALEDCTDSEWDTIESAVKQAIKAKVLDEKR